MTLQRRVKRRSGKRGSSGKGGGGTSESELIFASAEVKYEAQFLRNYLSLDKETRKDMSHQLTLETSRIGSPIKGLVGRCTYSGRDCLFDE